MPQDLLADYIICYDITCPKRLAKSYRIISSQAFFLQRSAYYIRAKPSEIIELLNCLNDFLDANQDDVRVYPVHQPLTLTRCGLETPSSKLILY